MAKESKVAAETDDASTVSSATTESDVSSSSKGSKGKKSKKTKGAPKEKPKEDPDDHAHEDHYVEGEHDEVEAENNTIHRPRVQTVRAKLTGMTAAVLKKKVAEKEKKKAEKERTYIPQTEEEIESKRVMKEASHKRFRERSKEPAQECYKALNFHAETGELNLANRGLKSDITSGLEQVLMHQGLSEPPVGSLHSLILRTNMIQFDGTERLCNALKYDINKVLVYLDLSECAIGVRGAKAIGEMLKQNESLLEVRLKYNKIGHEGTAFIANGLAHNSSLENLSLKGNAILDIGAEHLGAVHFGNVVDLDLRENYIGNHGCAELAKGFKGNRCLRRLNLRENPFGDEGRWAIGRELSLKRKRYWAKQKEKKVYEGKDYVPPTQREKDLAMPKIDFAEISIEPRPLLAWLVMTECPKCLCSIM